jgi:hypothetical protein
MFAASARPVPTIANYGASPVISFPPPPTSCSSGCSPHPNRIPLIDRRWQLVSANQAALVFVEGVAPALIEPACNVCARADRLRARHGHLDNARGRGPRSIATRTHEL